MRFKILKFGGNERIKLSILFMRFCETIKQLERVETINFQFSLWDSKLVIDYGSNNVGFVFQFSLWDSTGTELAKAVTDKNLSILFMRFKKI